MKEQITKFDLADAFKALDDIAVPSVKGVRANRLDLSEATKRVDRLSMLVEDYYNVQDQAELEQANNDIQADVAKAKLAKIEKIVDLDAETPEDIQPSYVGKTIIQCPQCMTLFYKDAADIEKSEEDSNIVNVGEICQHCGNDSGYTLVGKVAEETPDEIPAEEPVTEETPIEEPTVEEPIEEEPVGEEETTEEETVETELPELDLEAEEEPVKEETSKKEESLNKSEFLKDAEDDAMNTENHSENLTLNEDLDTDMAQFNAYIDYLQKLLEQDEKALEEAKKIKDNDLTISMLEKRIEADKAELDAALPQAVKDKQNEEELPTMEEIKETEEVAKDIIDDTAEETTEIEDTDEKSIKEESLNKSEFLKDAEGDIMNTENHSENLTLNEDLANKKNLDNDIVIDEAKTAKEVKYNTYTEIMWALTGGKHIKDALNRTVISSGPYNIIDVGINYDTNKLKVYGENEEALQPAIDIANKFGKTISEIKFDKYISGNKKYTVEIQLNPEDYEDGEFEESLNRSKADDYKMIRAGISDNRTINEAAPENKLLSKEELNNTFKLLKTPISEKEVDNILRKNESLDIEENVEDVDLSTFEDISEKELDECGTKYFTEVYENVNNFTTTNCTIKDNKLIVEGIINFTSGKQRKTIFEFVAIPKASISGNIILEGYNKDLTNDKAFKLYATGQDSNKYLCIEGLDYNYKINESVVKGHVGINLCE